MRGRSQSSGLIKDSFRDKQSREHATYKRRAKRMRNDAVKVALN